MDERQNIQEEERLQAIVEMLEAGKELSEEELDMLLADEESLLAYQDALTAKNALMQEMAADIPDVRQEWELFEARTRKDESPAPRIRHLSPLTSFILGMAASLLLVFGYFWYTGRNGGQHGFDGQLDANSVLAYEMNTDAQHVVLETGDGSPIVLDRNTDEQALQEEGLSLEKKDTLVLAYQTKGDASEASSNRPESMKVETHHISTPRGQDFKVVLADGTTVWLNAESRLDYPSQFTGSQRVVTLKGEAYFKVAKDASHPFVILADKMSARVLGTELNVRSYSDNDSRITLINGSVAVSRRGETDAIALHPGDEALLKTDGTFSVKQVDTDYYLYWKDGFSYYDNVPLVDIMQSIGRWYNVNVVFENKKLVNLRLRYFYQRHAPLSEAIGHLNDMKKVRVRQEGNTLYVSS